MPRYRTRLRIDMRTGQVESAVVEAVEANVYDPEHDADHVRATGEFGRLLDPLPDIREILPGDRAGTAPPTGRNRLPAASEDEPETGPEVVPE